MVITLPLLFLVLGCDNRPKKKGQCNSGSRYSLLRHGHQYIHDSHRYAKTNYKIGQVEMVKDDKHEVAVVLMGVEPTYAAWEAAVLPMNYSRI